MKSILMAVVTLSLVATSAFAQDLAKATAQADCEKAGGKWNVQTNGCAEESAKMGKEEGTHEDTNLDAAPDQNTQKVKQPERGDSGN
jgi:opacity protein-like surface antigen